MEIHLDRKLAERRVFPAIDIQRSGTRREELLLDEGTLKQVWLLRRMVTMITSGSMESTEATEKVMERMKNTPSNKEFLSNLTKNV
jgi:transcription termination factor Rho